MTPAAGDWTLRLTEGGAILERGGARPDCRWVPEDAGGRWEAPDGTRVAVVRHGPAEGEWSVEEAGVRASASCSEPLGENGAVYYLLLADGRLFRLAPRGTRPGGFELTGWDTPGPYLIARPDSVGWSFETRPAGRDLEGLRTLMVLVATRIVEQDRTGGNEPS